MRMGMRRFTRLTNGFSTKLKNHVFARQETVAAAAEIADRCEGRARQSIDLADVSTDLRARSDDELRFYLANGRWPEDDELGSEKTVPHAVKGAGEV